MALLDLSLVTRSLVRLVDEAIKLSPAKPVQPVTVTSMSPDRLAGDNVVGLYLYHLVEQAAHKNQVWRGRPDHPIRFSPLGLDLHYVVCAKSELTEEQGPYREQLLMGLALKALHDYPIIDDATTIGSATILDAALVGEENRLRLALRHVPVNEAISYWTAGSQPLRLSAYYEVSVVLLDREEVARGGGRVLTYGIDVLAGGLPRLATTRSTVRFAIPGEPPPREVEVQPAQVALGEEVTLLGTGLGGGAIALRVRASGWSTAREVGAGWGVNGGGDRVFATIHGDVDGEPTIPGTYTASLAVTRQGVRADGTAYTTTLLSNETPFLVTPAITAIGPVAGGVFAITGGLFADPRTPPQVAVHVRASIGGVQLVPGAPGALQEGEFAVVSPTEIELRLPPGALPGQPLPIRIEVQGAEAAPRWVTP